MAGLEIVVSDLRFHSVILTSFPLHAWVFTDLRFQSGSAISQLCAGQRFFSVPVKEIHNIFEKRRNVQYTSQIVSISEIAENDWNLNVSRYVEPRPLKESVPLPQATSELKDAIGKFLEAEKSLAKALKMEGLLHGK